MNTVANPTEEHSHLVRERYYSPAEFEHVLLMIHEERLIGQVILDCHLGGVCGIRVREEKHIPENTT